MRSYICVEREYDILYRIVSVVLQHFFNTIQRNAANETTGNRLNQSNQFQADTQVEPLLGCQARKDIVARALCL